MDEIIVQCFSCRWSNSQNVNQNFLKRMLVSLPVILTYSPLFSYTIIELWIKSPICAIVKNKLMILTLVLGSMVLMEITNWERPIYFTCSIKLIKSRQMFQLILMNTPCLLNQENTSLTFLTLLNFLNLTFGKKWKCSITYERFGEFTPKIYVKSTFWRYLINDGWWWYTGNIYFIRKSNSYQLEWHIFRVLNFRSGNRKNWEN